MLIHRVVALLTFVLAFANVTWECSAASRLEWDANTEPDLSGYKVYVGTRPQAYTSVYDTGAETSFSLTNLPAGVTHYFAVTAYNGDGVESDFSEEIIYTPPVDGVSAAQLPAYYDFTSGEVKLRFQGRAGQECRVLASSDLVVWEEVWLSAVAGTDRVEVQAGPTAQHPVRFYRVVVTPP